MQGPARVRTSPKTPKTKPERRLQVVRTSTRRRPRAPFIVLVVALMALGLVGLLLINTTMQRGAFELTELQERADTLHTREQALQLEVASMSSPDHIATRAARLGMVPNASPAFLRLPDGKIIGRPSPALPGTNLPGIAGRDRHRAADSGAERGDENGNDDQGRNDRAEENGRDGQGDRSDQNGRDDRDRNDQGDENGRDDRDRNGHGDRSGRNDRQQNDDRGRSGRNRDTSGGDR